MLNYKYLKKNSERKGSEMSQKQSTLIKNIDLFIIDECSMLNKKELARIDLIFRNVRDNILPFGGCHVLLAGDFFQLPPTSQGKALYVPVDSTSNSLEDQNGFILWQMFTNVVILTENMRQLEDPEWSLGCQNARKGVWTAEMIEILNSRVLPDLSIAHLFGNHISLPLEEKSQELLESINGFPYVPFITPSNIRRNIIINEYMSQSSKCLLNNDMPIRLVATFSVPKIRMSKSKKNV